MAHFALGGRHENEKKEKKHEGKLHATLHAWFNIKKFQITYYKTMCMKFPQSGRLRVKIPHIHTADLLVFKFSKGASADYY